MYVVAKGFAFTSKRGMIKEGGEITEKDFASKEAFSQALAKKKIIDSSAQQKEKPAANEKPASEKKDGK
jgi:hypothetical protein